MSVKDSSGRLRVFWIVAGTCLVVALAVALLSRSEGAGFEPTKKPVATFDTEGGGRLEILRVSSGKMEFGEARKAARFFSLGARGEGSSGGRYGGVNFYREEKNEKTTYLRIEGDSPDDLIMEVRLLDGSGDARVVPTYLDPSGNVMNDGRMNLRVIRKSDFYEPKNEDLAGITDAMAASDLEVLFQYRDPDSGWINMGGPGMAWEEWPDRYYLTLDSWQRNQTDLGFRMIGKDGTVTEFRLPNPDFKKAPAPLKPVSLPAIRTGKNFVLTVNGVTRSPFPGEHPFAALDMEISYTGPAMEGLPKGPIHFEGNGREACDEWGNVTSVVRETVGGRTVQGISLPENSRFASTRFRIQMNRSYPQDQNSGIPVLEGTVNATGTSIDFTKTSGAEKFSLVSIGNCKIQVPGHNSFPATHDKAWRELSFEIECRASTGKFERLKPKIGGEREWLALVFIGEDTLSSGLGHARSGGFSSTRDEVSMKDGFSRIFPPSALQPGRAIRLAIHRAPADEEIEMVLPLPVSARLE